MTDQIRPRLSKQEALFISEVLTMHQEWAERKLKELENCKRRVKQLRDKFVMYPGRFFEQLREERQHLKQLRQSIFIGEEVVAQRLAKRFKLLSDGKQIHTGYWTTAYLEKRKPYYH